MRALQYFFSEAFESLWRSQRAALLSMLTIAAGLFVLGFFLMVNANLQRIIGGWSDAAELSVYLRDDAPPQQIATINELLTKSGLAASVTLVSKEDARKEFARDFPDLASAAAALERNPFPASFAVRLNPAAQSAPGAIENLTTTLTSAGGVADVRYDRTWIARLNSTVRVIRAVGLAIIFLLAIAAALTVANVVRLTAMARRNEIEIMQLVGAPFAYIRGPFIAEGLVQGGLGALAAIVLLLVTFAGIRARFGTMMTEAIGLTGVAFVPTEILLLLVVGGMALGCIGGFVVARSVR
ncbi:MAG TPA: ABC transporter permease [Vicinamibacterales bacterium]|nr:ABC transporter permease [Vicinamibacterales bacterium]